MYEETIMDGIGTMLVLVGGSIMLRIIGVWIKRCINYVAKKNH